MAKKKEKTLEEKLQEALVPENQWPYILPENWCWVEFGSLAKDMADGPFGSNLKTEHYINEKEVRIIQLSNVSENGWKDDNVRYTTFEHAKTISRSIVKPGDIVITKMMPAGRAMICPNLEKEYVLSSDSVKFVPWDCLDRKYMTLGINSTVFRKQVQENTQGITRARTSLKKLKSYIYPLAPLAEQKRIVYRIESLFAKLDEAKEKIQQVLDGAEMRKAAILHKAFTGELTKTWRRENNITTTDDVNREKLSKECEEYEIPYEIPDEWRWVTFNEVCTFIGSGVTPKGGQAVYTDSGIPFIRSQNVLNGKLDLSDVAYISDEINEKMKRTQIIGGETLLNITGASIGRSCYVPQEQSVGNVNQHVCILRFKNYINGYIPQLWLNSPKMQEFINFNQVGQTRQALNFKQIRGIYFPLPPLQEQLEMVRIIKYEINKLDVVCNSLANLAVRIDTMKKSILAKAFRGELGTNNPTEDSALNLLKEVLQDKF